MSKIYHSVQELIGNTPLLQLTHLQTTLELKANLLAKLEYLNPAGSIKDRVASNMLAQAEKEGKVNKDTIIIEPTSGNTGIGLACVCAAKGYSCIIVMPDSMSKERILTMEGYGAQVVLTPGKLGMKGAIDKAKELSEENPNSFIPGQFDNPHNPETHYEMTGPEIWNDTDGNVDYFIAGVGTGGTITGIGKYLKEMNPDVKVVGIEPASSPLLSRGYAGSHGLQGIGANFIPSILDISVMDEIVTVTEDEAYHAARLLGKNEGILVGISSGAALHAAIEFAKREENAGKNIVVLLPDTGDRYLSTPLFQ